MAKTNCDFLIIGTGATGTAMMAQLAKMKPTKPFSVVVVEKNKEFGPGFPYNSDVVLPDHLVNIAAGCTDITKTDIRYSELSDFVEWVKSLPAERREAYGLGGIFEQTNIIPPRYVIGEYLKERFKQFSQQAQRNGVGITFIS